MKFFQFIAEIVLSLSLGDPEDIGAELNDGI